MDEPTKPPADEPAQQPAGNQSDKPSQPAGQGSAGEPQQTPGESTKRLVMERPRRPASRQNRPARKSRLWWIVGGAVLLAAAAVLYFLLSRPDLGGEIVIPYIAHQKPTIDPHLPSTNALSDKLDEVEFDGLFNLTASPSGVVYEDGLGELLGVDANTVVSIRLKPNRRWHDSYRVTIDRDKMKIDRAADHLFNAKDLNFTLKRIQSLGTLSPDYILV